MGRKGRVTREGGSENELLERNAAAGSAARTAVMGGEGEGRQSTGRLTKEVIGVGLGRGCAVRMVENGYGGPWWRREEGLYGVKWESHLGLGREGGKREVGGGVHAADRVADTIDSKGLLW